MVPHGCRPTRRLFLLHASWLAPVLGARRLEARPNAEAPFDSLPAGVWNNARQNGMVMIHRPAPIELSWRTQIMKDGEPGIQPKIRGGYSARFSP